MIFHTNGSVVCSSPEGGRQSVTADKKSADMSWTMSPELPDPIPPRHSLLTQQQSSSLPTSPYQQPRDLPVRTRSPSLGRELLDTSPRSTRSENGQIPPPTRSLQGGCKYEVAQLHLKRRIPYSEGAEPLEPPDEKLKERLTEEEDSKVTQDMKHLYESLLPTPESEERRAKLVKKLEGILLGRWPGYHIKVTVFGSTGNKLGTSDSDVDICVTTDCKAIEHICNLAELCAKKGMERVVCIAGAKVPIVKIWDPELQLACDLNVNQHIALENTAMIRTYVDLDDRVRPLAMIVKYWTRRRILNDAGRNFTVSSYTWICMIINFLQTRDPPILPSLQQQPKLEKREINGIDVSFSKEIESLRNFGAQNTESIGQLLFQFFRYYGYELDYETSLVSVRQGKVVEKSDRWQRQQNNRLCVEEPFNTSWNLGRTADDTSFRGVHRELRRAFDLISQADLEGCCEQYVFPKEEQRSAAIPIQKPQVQPVTMQPSRSTRNSRPRNGNTFPRNNQSQSRRASSASNNRNQGYGRQASWTLTPQEFSIQAEQQRNMLHDHLYQQYQLLQAQEQELRMQLHQQAMQNGSYQAILFPTFRFSHDDLSRARAGTVNHPPMTAPIRQGQFTYGNQYLANNMRTAQGTSTSPPSPLLASAVPENRRNSRRSSITTGSSHSTLRAHSQPAQRPLRSPVPQHIAHLEGSVRSTTVEPGATPRRKPADTSYAGVDVQQPYFGNGTSPASSLQNEPRRNSAYVAYYLGQSPELQAQQGSALVSHQNDLQNLDARQQSDPFVGPNGPIMLENGYDTRNGFVSTSLSSEAGSISVSPTRQTPQATPRRSTAPLVVDGSKPITRHTYASEDSSGYESIDSNGERLEAASVVGTTPESQVFVPGVNGISPGKPNFTIPQYDALGIIHGHPSPEARTETTQEKDLSIVIPSPSKSSVNGGSGQEISPLSERKPKEPPKKPDIPQISRSQALSPVKEVRTPSPVSSRDIGSTGTEKHASNRNKTKNNNRHDKNSNTNGNVESIPPSALANKTNGSSLSTEISKPSQNGQPPANGWQTATTKKKHKKGAKSTNDLLNATTNAIGGEFLPADEKMRKGG